jgi:hypothetical protein
MKYDVEVNIYSVVFDGKERRAHLQRGGLTS